MRRFIITVAIAAATLAFALAFFFAGFYTRGVVDEETPASQTVVQQQVGSLVVPNVSADDDPALGPEDAPLLFVQFSDYQCPFSKRFFDETESIILSEYGNQVHYVFRDFPLAGHPEARKAAEAAQCAHEQDKYWEYHDLLFQNQQALEEDGLKIYAESLGLDMGTFTLCLDSDKYASEVEKDIEDGKSYGVAGSPTFFINGRKVAGALPYTTFRDVIEEELAKIEAH